MKIDIQMHIGHRSMTKGKGLITIEIEDKASRCQVGEIQISAEEFGFLLAGNGFNDAVMTLCDNHEIIGKNAETDKVGIPKEIFEGIGYAARRDGPGRDAVELYLQVNGYLTEGWFLWQDGFSSQQNGELHRVILRRYVEVTETE